MRPFLYAVAVGVPLALTACGTGLVPPTTPGGVCADVHALSPAVVAILDAYDPHSAVGVLWADVVAGCATGSNAAPTWVALVWAELRALLPTLFGLL